MADYATNYAGMTIGQLLPKAGAKVRYEYDFGDGWLHTILLEKTLSAEPDRHYPACLAGRRACPPEDCGGVPGYEMLLETLADPRHPDYADLMEWTGGPIDAEEFDLAAINQKLRFM